MNLRTTNYADSVLAALVVSVKTEMTEMYKQQLNALDKLNMKVDMVGETEAIDAATRDINELSKAIRLVENALDREFKPKPIIRTCKTELCPNCHHRVKQSHSYCHRCGQKLAKGIRAAVHHE